MLNYQRGTFLMSLDVFSICSPNSIPCGCITFYSGMSKHRAISNETRNSNLKGRKWRQFFLPDSTSISSHHFYRILWSWSGEAKIQASDHCNSRSTSCRMGMGIADPTGLWNNASGPRNCNSKIKEHWEIAG